VFGDHQLRLAAAQAQLDAGRAELGGDLVGGLRERVEKGQPGGGVDRAAQQLGRASHLGAARRRSRVEIAAEAFDERCDVHDVTMPPK
jgi:hypothetical protein